MTANREPSNQSFETDREATVCTASRRFLPFERTPRVSNEFLINQLCRRTGAVETLPRCFYREPTGAGGTGAPSRSASIARVLLTRDSLPGLFLLSLPTVGFFTSSTFFDDAAGLNAVGCGAISGVVLAPAPGRGHEKSRLLR